MRIAIASSGLGHVNRGIETWAADTASALKRAGHAVELFQGGGVSYEDWRQAIWCWRRADPRTLRLLTVTTRIGGWRYGFGSAYQIEQSTFAVALWLKVRRKFDVVHLQDPWTAGILERLHSLGVSRPRVILAHGTNEEPLFLKKFSTLQLWTPFALESWEQYRPGGQKVFSMPNFVDTKQFYPGDQGSARTRFGLPEDAFIVLCVAAIKKRHKRIDYLIAEFSQFAEEYGGPAVLILAGAREADTEELRALGKKLLGDRVRFYENLSRNELADLYRSADVFVLPSLREMFGLVLIEAMASGLPVCCHDNEEFRWITGAAGYFGDLQTPGVLAGLLKRVATEGAERARKEAIDRVNAFFTEEAVVPRFIEMYKAVLS